MGFNESDGVSSIQNYAKKRRGIYLDVVIANK